LEDAILGLPKVDQRKSRPRPLKRPRLGRNDRQRLFRVSLEVDLRFGRGGL